MDLKLVSNRSFDMGYEIIKMDEHTWRVEDGMVRFFILTGTEKALLIDSGMMVRTAKDIAEELTRLPVMLINTHGDRDHVGSNSQFDTFYMHPDEKTNYYEVQKLNGTFQPVVEGDRIELGERTLEVIEIPGHTPGSIAILDLQSRVIFCGDTVQDGQIFMFGSQRNLEVYRNSLKKLQSLSDRFDWIYPSHGTIPVEPKLIDTLYEVSGKLRDGEYPVSDMEIHETQVDCVDTGVARFLLDKENKRENAQKDTAQKTVPACNPYMEMAIAEAREGIYKNHGGPFGTVIVKNGEVIGRGHNMVLANNDSTAHGEITAIRNAEANSNSYDLSGAVLYTTGEPCTMCLAACLWANIEKVYYGCTIADNALIGFRDEVFDQKFGGRESFQDYLVETDREACLQLFEEYNNLNREKY
ncbi:MAG: deaminase [Lachnospiraceae bacterium]|nr:deaminase [Lachnospiraceae bacterium]